MDEVGALSLQPHAAGEGGRVLLTLRGERVWTADRGVRRRSNPRARRPDWS